MKPSITVKQLADNTAELRNAMNALTKQDVYIGIPAEKAGRDEGGITNAEIGYIHEHGGPAAGIPARPHLIPGIEAIVPEAVALLKGAAQKALEGNTPAVETALNKIGVLGQNSVRNAFVDNDWLPLKDETLDYQALQKDESGAVLTDKKGKPKREKSRRERGRVNPLVDTSQLRRGYTYVIRKRGVGMITPGGK